MITSAEVGADFAVGGVGQFSGEEHGDSAGNGECFSAGVGAEVCGVDAEGIADEFFDVADANESSAFVFHTTEEFAGDRGVDAASGELELAFELVDGALEFADVAVAAAEDVIEGVVVEDGTGVCGEGHEESSAGFRIGWIHAADETAEEAGGEFFAVFGEHFGVSIGGDDNLSAVVADLNDCVEKFFLSGAFVIEEFDVVDEEDIDVAEALSEGWDCACGESGGEAVGECFAGEVHHVAVGEIAASFGVDGFEEVSFTGAGASEEEQWVIAVSGAGGDLFGGKCGEVVAFADYEGFEVSEASSGGCGRGIAVGIGGLCCG